MGSGRTTRQGCRRLDASVRVLESDPELGLRVPAEQIPEARGSSSWRGCPARVGAGRFRTRREIEAGSGFCCSRECSRVT